MATPLSKLADSLKGSEIVKIGNAIRERVRLGETIYNFTIGDFNPHIFPIPPLLEDEIVKAYREHFTNYPVADGELDLRQAVSRFIEKHQGIRYSADEIQIAAGGRPLIYAIFRAVVDAGDKVIYAIPSWNNNHYVHLTGAQHCLISTKPENNFMPTATDIEPHLQGASLLCLCTPQNPTGTTLGKEELEKICRMVLAENKRRAANEKKLYVMFDQMYWTLTFGNTKHFHPVGLIPEMKEYTIYVDGISKAFAATGVRVGWGLGPAQVIARMKAILTHVGAWAPMPEQKATAAFLNNDEAIAQFLEPFKQQIEMRLQKFYDGMIKLKQTGFAVDAIPPQAAIYLTLKFDLKGKMTESGQPLATQQDVTDYLLAKAHLALVPFYCFGDSQESPWYRLSVGTCRIEEIEKVFEELEVALQTLQQPVAS